MSGDGGPAFPRTINGYIGGGGDDRQDGMSLRDYFAGQAMAGALAGRSSWPHGPASEPFADACYELADAMLKAMMR